MTFEGFVGQSYQSRSIAWDAQRTVNMYLESDESGADEAPKALIGTPGLTLFDTLPTSPVRGIWTGLIDNLPGETGVDLCFVVAGSKLYQVFSNGTHTQLGDVGNDSANSPVTFQVNGTQVLITSAGLAYIWDNVSVKQVWFNNGQGECYTIGTAVTWVSGDGFNASLVNTGIWINGTAYIITGYTDEAHITLGSSAGSSVGQVPFQIFGGGGSVNTSGTAVTWVGPTGSPAWQLFTPSLSTGSPITIGSTLYTVASVTDATHLTLTASAGTQTNQVYSAPQAVSAAMSAFCDTYFFVVPAGGTKSYYISAINDGTLWNPLDNGTKSGFPDNIASILFDHEEIYLMGSETSEVHRDTGNALFPFQRDTGAFIHQGIRAPFSLVNLANGVAWIGGDVRGNPIAWLAVGYQPQRVSTHAVEQAWGEYSTITDAIAFVYVMDGHQFWVISFPTANATWVYDATEGAWHERGWWNGTGWDRVRYATHGYAWGSHIVGDWQNGQLYQLSLDVYTDNGTAIHRMRTAPYISEEENYTFYSRFRLSMSAGLNPTLTWSDDLGASYHTAVTASGRTFGTVSQQSVWRRLGKGRSRIYSVLISDAAKVALTGAFIDASAGAA